MKRTMNMTILDFYTTFSFLQTCFITVEINLKTPRRVESPVEAEPVDDSRV